MTRKLLLLTLVGLLTFGLLSCDWWDPTTWGRSDSEENDSGFDLDQWYKIAFHAYGEQDAPVADVTVKARWGPIYYICTTDASGESEIQTEYSPRDEHILTIMYGTVSYEIKIPQGDPAGFYEKLRDGKWHASIDVAKLISQNP